MNYPTCWRCFGKSRSPLFSPTSFYLSRLFTTCAPVQNPGGAPTFLRGNKDEKKGEPQKFIRRRAAKPRPKKTAIGERAALRKRIVLSNNNAIAVEGVPEFGDELIQIEQLRAQVVSLPVSLVHRLRAVEAFKRTQSWGLFRNPAMLIRRETIEYFQLLDEISEQKEGSRRSMRKIILGERGCGKSMILLQAMAIAFLKDWVVINLPEAQDIVIGHTEYGPIPQTSPPLYQQKVYTAGLLSAIARANPILSTLTLKVPPPPTPTPIYPAITLDQFALLGAADPEIAYVIFQTLVQDLLLPSRPPLLLCIDNLAHAMKFSAYRNAAFNLIHAHDLAILNWFMSHLSGASELPNGGMVLAAMSGSNSASNPSLDAAIKQYESLHSPTDLYMEAKPGQLDVTGFRPDPYVKFDQRVMDVFSRDGMQIEHLKGLSKDEAWSLMAYWAKSGWVRQKVDDTFVNEKLALSGGGIIKELERATMTMRT